MKDDKVTNEEFRQLMLDQEQRRRMLDAQLEKSEEQVLDEMLGAIDPPKVAKPEIGNKVSAERELLAKCKAQFEFYAEQHTAKNTIEGDNKARANAGFAEEIGDLLATKPPEDILNVGEQVADYRFARFIKGDNYAYARGLTINPTHLPKALDAMLVDGWKVLSVFGETDSERIGIIFERVATAAKVLKAFEMPKYEPHAPFTFTVVDAEGFGKPRGG